MPQPISYVRPNANIFLGNNTDNPSDHRRELALLAMKVIAEWSILESFIEGLFVAMLGANPSPAAAIYAVLISPRAQREALGTLADIALSSQDEKDVFEAILRLRDAAIQPRNDIAHYVWGHSPEIPDGVLLCKSEVLMQFNVALKEYRDALGIPPWPPMPELPRDKVFVWYARDFTNASAQIQGLIGYITKFRTLLTRRDPVNQGGQLLQLLLSEPQIHEHVSRIRARRQSGQASQR